MSSVPSAAHRFFVAAGAVTAAGVAFSAEQQQQIRRVLRLREGERVIACPGDGTELIVILRVAGQAVSGEIDAVRSGLPEPRRPVWLYQSALRGDRFTWLLQKGTEIGVAGFVPVRYRYTQVADYATKLGRYLAVVREAAEQCGRSTLPAVLPALQFEAALASTPPGSLRLLLDEDERAASLVDALAEQHQADSNLAADESNDSPHPVAVSGTSMPSAPGTAVPVALPFDRSRRLVDRSRRPMLQSVPLCLFVGPEGGLHPDERALALAAGVAPVSLGGRVLRSETAGLVAATLALAASGDLGSAPPARV